MLPQFSFRMLLIMVASCGISTAVMVQSTHIFLTVMAGCVPVFWTGIVIVLVGAGIELLGDRWLMVGVFTGIVGALVCVISLFTGVYYLGTYVGTVWLFS